MKRGVPPTARNARTGELTPPGMTRCARSNNEALLVVTDSSVDAALRRLALAIGRFRCRLVVIGRHFAARALFALLCRRQRPEEAVGQHAAHAGAKARV